MPLVSREEFALVMDEDVSVERFNALYATARRIAQGAYPTDVEDLTGRPADVVAGVITSVMARILSNPKAARTLSAGAAAVTFGGADAEITRVFSLNEDERLAMADAQRVVGLRTGAFTAFRPGLR